MLVDVSLDHTTSTMAAFEDGSDRRAAPGSTARATGTMTGYAVAFAALAVCLVVRYLLGDALGVIRLPINAASAV